MTTNTILTTPAPPRPGVTHEAKITPTRVLNAEWIKFRTLRSSWYTLAAAVIAMVAFGLAVGYITSTSDWTKIKPEDTLPSATLQGFHFAQLLIGVLGVLFVTGEYGTGMIRSTFAAVPNRLSVLGAKAAIFGSITAVAMTAASFAAFLGAQVLFLSPHHHGTALTDPGVLRAIVGTAVFLTLVGLLGGAIGWIVRSTAGSISALVGILLILPVILELLPGTVTTTIASYLPANAGESFVASVRTPGMLSPWAGFAVFVAWVLAAVAAAAFVLQRRDA